jgi:hypothetical protein
MKTGSNSLGTAKNESGRVPSAPESFPTFLRSRSRFRRYRVRRVSFSSFAVPDSFWAVPRVSGPVYIFAHVDSFSTVSRASAPVFMFCVPGLVFDGSEGIGSCFLILRARNHFRRYRGRRVPLSCFVRPDSFSAETRVPAAIFMFCAPRIVSRGTKGVGSRFQVLRSQTHFRRYCGHWVPFSCFALPISFSTVPRASTPVLMFCATGLIFGGTEGIGYNFHVLRARTHFPRYRVRRVSFS